MGSPASVPRHTPVKVTTAPISVRPASNAAASAATSKSLVCKRIFIGYQPARVGPVRTATILPRPRRRGNASPARHGREKGNLARLPEPCLRRHVGAVESRPDDPRIGKRARVFLTAGRKPMHQLAYGRDACG